MGRVVHDAPLHPQDLGDAFPGPDLATEPIRCRATAQPCGHTCERLGGQPAGCARRWSVA
jgi:hypothetical protein